jgi:hypothetical protein
LLNVPSLQKGPAALRTPVGAPGAPPAPPPPSAPYEGRANTYMSEPLRCLTVP